MDQHKTHNPIDAPMTAFANMLNEMRYGRMQDSTIEIFTGLDRKVVYTDGIEPTELYDFLSSLFGPLTRSIETNSPPDTLPEGKLLTPTVGCSHN